MGEFFLTKIRSEIDLVVDGQITSWFIFITLLILILGVLTVRYIVHCNWIFSLNLAGDVYNCSRRYYFITRFKLWKDIVRDCSGIVFLSYCARQDHFIALVRKRNIGTTLNGDKILLLRWWLPVNSKQWRSCIYIKTPVRTHHLDYQKKNVLKTVYYNNFIAKQETLTGCANYNK